MSNFTLTVPKGTVDAVQKRGRVYVDKSDIEVLLADLVQQAQANDPGGNAAKALGLVYRVLREMRF